jgi:SAM-dependent methyltransferase
MPHMSVNAHVFDREPLSVLDGIPVFSTPDRFNENYEQISRDHLESLKVNGTNPWIPERLWRRMEATTIELIRKYSKPGDLILDAGVGLGRMLNEFPSLQRYGMDISQGYLKVSRESGIDVCYARLEDMPYKANTFDIVVCTDVLEHVLNLHLCCERLLHVLKDTGVLIVRVPVYEDLQRYLDPNFPYQYVHVRNFDACSLRLLFERIFDCNCLQLTPGGYWPLGDRLKITLPFARIGSIAFRGFSYVPVVRSVLYEPIVRSLYHPIDMNVVVQKRRPH